jgi:hypothetical protein
MHLRGSPLHFLSLRRVFLISCPKIWIAVLEGASKRYLQFSMRFEAGMLFDTHARAIVHAALYRFATDEPVEVSSPQLAIDRITKPSPNALTDSAKNDARATENAVATPLEPVVQQTSPDRAWTRSGRKGHNNELESCS